MGTVIYTRSPSSPPLPVHSKAVDVFSQSSNGSPRKILAFAASSSHSQLTLSQTSPLLQSPPSPASTSSNSSFCQSRQSKGLRLSMPLAQNSDSTHRNDLSSSTSISTLISSSPSISIMSSPSSPMAVSSSPVVMYSRGGAGGGKGGGGSHDVFGSIPMTPVSPNLFDIPILSSKHLSSHPPTNSTSSFTNDVDMPDDWATPPPLTRTLPSIAGGAMGGSFNVAAAGRPDQTPSTSQLRDNNVPSFRVIPNLRPTSALTPNLTPNMNTMTTTPSTKKVYHPSSSPLMNLQTSHLQCLSAPLTPPLTPPFNSIGQSLPLLPITLSSSPTPMIIGPSASPAPVPARAPPSIAPPSHAPTLSARILTNYRLHPLFDAYYTIHEELGCGGFGFVVRAVRNLDGRSVAVKFIQRSKIPSHGWVQSKYWGEAPGLSDPVNGVRNVPMEAFVLRSVRHEGVVAYIDLFEDEKYFYLVMEHHGSPWQSPDKVDPGSGSISGPATPAATAASSSSSSSSSSPQPLKKTVYGQLGAGSPATPIAIPSAAVGSVPLLSATQTATPISSPILASASLPVKHLPLPRPAPMMRRSSCDLFECIEQHRNFDEQTSKYVFAQVVEVVWALNQMGICHRDIKDENIVITTDMKVKLIDFGSSVIFDPRSPPPLYNRFHGTTSFASAEILRGEAYQAPPSEVWSLGVLLSILVTGECPFADAQAAQVGRWSRPKIRLSADLEHLMYSCLTVDVTKRINIGQIRNHPWLSDAFKGRKP